MYSVISSNRDNHPSFRPDGKLFFFKKKVASPKSLILGASGINFSEWQWMFVWSYLTHKLDHPMGCAFPSKHFRHAGLPRGIYQLIILIGHSVFIRYSSTLKQEKPVRPSFLPFKTGVTCGVSQHSDKVLKIKGLSQGVKCFTRTFLKCRGNRRRTTTKQ